MVVDLWTDGSSTGEVGPGGWAYLLRSGTHEKEASGYVPETTNQRMEMVGCLMGLRAQEWLKKWKSNGWMAGGSKRRHPVVNRDLWEALLVETARHNVTWKKVKGHSGNADNDRVDLLAVTAKKAGMDAFVEIELAAYEALTLVGS
jgi:ribonuclease HI